MKRILLLAALAGAAVLSTPGQGWACSCAPTKDATAIRENRVVFAGTLIDTRGPLIDVGTSKTLTYLFEVDTVVKGEVHERVLMQNLLQEADTCSGELNRGARYLVFGADEARMKYDLCSATHTIGEERIGGRSPLPGGPTLPPDPRRVVLVVAMGSAVGGYLLYRRFRDPLRI